MAESLTEGWTAPLDFICKLDGTAVDLTTATVELSVKDSTGATVDTVGDLSIVAPGSNGRVRYTPDPADFVASRSPYKVKVKVTVGGEIVFFPNGAADVWTIYAA